MTQNCEVELLLTAFDSVAQNKKENYFLLANEKNNDYVENTNEKKLNKSTC